MHIDEVEFTIFDTETTGLDPASGDRIIEIAGVRFKNEQIMGNFQSLISPGRAVSPSAFSVNNISDEMLIGAPEIDEVMPKFLEFAKDSCLCSYNASFDMGFLNSELRLLGKGPLDGMLVIDALKMARRILPGLPRYALWFVAKELGLANTQTHRAFSDVELTLKVFRILKGRLCAKGITDFNNFAGLFGINSKFFLDQQNQKIARIQEALDLGVALKIRYLSSASAQISEREVLPKQIRQENNNSYLVGHCRLRDEERTFRIDNIVHIEIV